MFLFQDSYEFLDPSDFMILQSLDTGIDHRLFDERECISDMLSAHFAIHHVLLEEGEGISESSSCRFRYDPQGFILSLYSLFFAYVFEPMDDIFESNLPEVESESTRSDGLRDFIDLSRREDEFHMSWWLFQSFEQSIECSGREHMDFIDDIDLIFPLVGLKSRSLDEITHILDSVIARTIDLDDIEEGIIVESLTVRTYMTRIAISWIETIQRLREYARTRRLTSSTRSMEEIGVMYSPSRETIS
jgi:hypothetical protein